MADIITTSDLSTSDNSKLSTGDIRRRYNKKKKKKVKGFRISKNKYIAGV